MHRSRGCAIRAGDQQRGKGKENLIGSLFLRCRRSIAAKNFGHPKLSEAEIYRRSVDVADAQVRCRLAVLLDRCEGATGHSRATTGTERSRAMENRV
jgi:hypothetical protein